MNKKELRKLKDLYIFLDADMPSQIFPLEKVRGELWKRKDTFKNRKEVEEYLKEYFFSTFPELNNNSAKP